MAFGWFSKGKDAGDKALVKAQKLEGQGRWAEALSYYQDALDRAPGGEDAKAGLRRCRERLVAFNLEESEAYRASDSDKAREHARLAHELAGSEADLQSQSWTVLESLKVRAEPRRPTAESAPAPLFATSCSCAAPCHVPEGAEEEAADMDVEDLAAFYLDACDPAEREAFEALGPTFREGFVRLHQGDLAAARPALEAAAREAPEAGAAAYALGLLCALEGEAGAAAEQFRRALAISPGFAPAARHLADVLREEGRAGEAVGFLRDWLDAHGDDGEGRLLLALCRLEGGDGPGARKEVDAARRLVEEGDVRPSLILARAHRLEGNRDGALRALQAALARRPDSLEALVPFGELLLETGGAAAEKAAEVFKRCYREDPDRGWYYLIQVARAYAARGWRTDAAEMLERVRGELPDAPDARQLWERARDAVEG
ncbi:MAG: tetratricopeptide repeat protein [Deltaproteobacteria bacterium]|nr:tetratricopeptide repeat protein [Deltaproteobacteria bacterium]